MNRPDGVYLGIVDLDSLIYYVNYILKYGIYEVGVDTETDSLDYLNCNILGISLAFKLNSTIESSKNNLGLYIPIKREVRQDVLWDSPSEYLSLEEIVPILNLLFDNTSITKVFHNAKFDLHILERQGFVISDPIFDTMIGAWVLGNVHGGKYGLKHLTKEKLGFDQLSFNEIVGKKGTFENVDLATAVAYAGPDGDMALRLANLEYKVIEKYPSLRKTLYLELNAIRVLKDMEEHGALIDVEYLRRTSRDLGKQMRHYEERVKGFLGNININSEQQLKEILRKKLGVDLDNVTKGTIEKLSQESEELKDILAYRERAKLKSVYCDGLIKLVDKNNYLHTDYYQMLKTGRLSSSNPNLQNIPTKKDDRAELPLIRRAFIVPEGHRFVSIDYSQLELRVITHVSGEQYWIDAFKNNEDIHASTAAAVNHIPLDQVTKYQRKRAKFVNFGLLYGESAYGLSRREGMTEAEAQEFIDEYFKVLPAIRDYVFSRKEMVVKQGYTETFNGRRLYFKVDKNDKRAVAAAQREGINFPIQGGASDIVKKAMFEVWNYLKPYRTKMILQIHDEICFSVPDEEVDIIIPRIEEIMMSVFKLKVDLRVDSEIGSNWEDLIDYNGKKA